MPSRSCRSFFLHLQAQTPFQDKDYAEGTRTMILQSATLPALLSRDRSIDLSDIARVGIHLDLIDAIIFGGLLGGCFIEDVIYCVIVRCE
jgi:hypothetical protein